MIITCKKKIPMRWVAFAVMPWAAFTMKDRAITVAFLFSLKKFIENPAGLSFVMSLSSFIAVIVAPVASFISDRIWTRFGRRKPFLVVAWAGMAAAMIVMPFAPNLITLLAAYFFFYICQALNAPMEPLKQEIIPPSERGRATGLMTWFSNIAMITFYFVMLGRFDDVTFMGGFALTGEAVIYWSAALLLLTMLILITLGIKEVDQHSPLRGEKLSLRTFVGGLLDRELWPVYLLVVGYAFLNFHSGMGMLSNLLYTDQWGYTKQEMGVNVAIGGLINVFLIGVLTIVADRLPRMRAYQTFIWLTLVGNFLFYAYVEFVLPDKRPTLIEIIVFGEMLSVISILTGIVYFPLIYDYVRRNKMGTFAAGEQIVRRTTVFFTANTVGLFVWVYAAFFQPPAGPMTRVVLRDETSEQQLVATVSETSAGISVHPWTADRSPAATSRAWEIRRRDKRGAKLADERTDLERERSRLSTDATAVTKNRIRLDAVSARIAEIDRTLEDGASELRNTVIKLLGDRPIADGDQILAAIERPAVLLEIATTERIDGERLERIVIRLRSQIPSIIDARPAKRDSSYGLISSAFVPTGENETTFARSLIHALSGASEPEAKDKTQASAFSLVDIRPVRAIELSVQVIEQPVSAYVSPIMRAVNAIWGFFAEVPSPTRRVDAITRSLRADQPRAHLRVSARPKETQLSVVLVPSTAEMPASVADEFLQRRLRTLLPEASDATLAAAGDIYTRVESAAATQRITVARPVLAHGYAPMRYDYMSGYLWMFLMSVIGISLTIVFTRLERRGVVRKRGVEESQAS